MRILGVDLGEKRIGIAISDDSGSIAFPAGFIERSGLRRDLQALCALVRDRGVVRAVVGLPVHMNGRLGPEAAAARNFAAALSEAAGIPVDTQDERWTTVEAERSLRASGRGRARPGPARSRAASGRAGLQPGGRGKGTVDAVAAALLLSTYLERRRSHGPEQETA